MSYDFILDEGRVIVFGDTRPTDPLEWLVGLENTDRVRPKMFQAIADEKPKALFHAGDIASIGALKKFRRGWQNYLQEAKPIRDAGLLVFPALGNHDLRGPKTIALRNYFEVFPHLQGKRYYSVLVGQILYLVLDSNFRAISRDLCGEQLCWLKKTLEIAQEDPHVLFVFPIFHHPPFSNVKMIFVYPSSRSEEYFVNAFRRYSKVKVVFCGHVHSYEHIDVGDGKHYIVTGGGGSPRFKVRVGERTKYKDLYPEDGGLRDFHYVRVTPAPNFGEGVSSDSASGSAKIEMVRLRNNNWSVGEIFEVRGEQ